MSDELKALEDAEIAYLLARGWVLVSGMATLWVDPMHKHCSHTARVAAYKQRQRDTAAENAKAGAK